MAQVGGQDVETIGPETDSVFAVLHNAGHSVNSWQTSQVFRSYLFSW